MPRSRGRTVQQRAASTRRAVLVTAAELFYERGYLGTSISDIGSRSGLTSGSIYFHFGSKQQLAVRVVEEHFAGWPPLISRCAQLPATALEKLICLSFHVARMFRDDPVTRGGGRLWNERESIGAALPPPFVGWISTATVLLGQARGDSEIAADLDLDTAASTLISAFYGVHTVSEALDRRRDIEQRVTALWELFLPGLRPRSTPGELLARARFLLDTDPTAASGD